MSEASTQAAKMAEKVIEGDAKIMQSLPRLIITICVMIATLMQALDSTVANVALPYIQGSLSASYDQITWVLTSYVIAAAIFTAPVGWLTARFGAKNLLLVSLIAFTLASMLCGLASNLTEIVIDRFLQGVFGAAMIPVAQAVMLDIYPAKQRGMIMSVWSSGVMLGPIVGPTLGGFLTSNFGWRYVFFVNIPFGILAVLGLLFFMPHTAPGEKRRFDWIGFFMLSLGLAAMQFMLDRGEELDWFSSPTIIICAVLAVLGFYLFLVHLMTAKDPFIQTAVFKDLNLDGCLITMLTVGMTLLASSALLAPFLENLGNYPVETAGMVMAPRGIATMAALLLAGQLMNRLNLRAMMLFGYIMLATSMIMQWGWTPDVSAGYIALTTTFSGIGFGFIFVPLQVMAYATLAPALRTQAAALLALMRNIGSAIGVAVTSAMLDHQTQYEHAVLAQYITPFTRPLRGAASMMLNPVTPAGASLLNSVVTTQSQIIGYIDDYKLMFICIIPAALSVFFMRSPPRTAL